VRAPENTQDVKMDAEGVVQEGILEQVGRMERWQEGVRDRVLRGEDNGAEGEGGEDGGDEILNLRDS